MFGKGTFTNDNSKKHSLVNNNKEINCTIDQSRGVEVSVGDLDKSII
jgi:hypothetical protein